MAAAVRTATAEASGSSESAGGLGRQPSSSSVEAARKAWRAAVEAEGKGCAPPASVLRRWLGKATALHHLRSAAPHASIAGRFDDLEGDLTSAVPRCLQFLADGLSGRDGEATRPQWCAEAAGAMEGALAERLREVVVTLAEAGCDWRWEVGEIDEAWVDRVFVIFGVSRTRMLHRGPVHIMSGFGNQFVVGHEQAEFDGRAGALQKLLDSDRVVVADVKVLAKQHSSLWCRSTCLTDAPESGGAHSPPGMGEMRAVEHVLRMEMALSQEHGQFSGNGNVLQASPWHIADWNWLCYGNHPALQRGDEAPW